MSFPQRRWASFPFLVILVLLSAPASFAASCESLASLGLPNVTVTSVESVAQGDFVLSGGRGGDRRITDLPAFCRVLAILTPSPDSNIRTELWMPVADDWNGKYPSPTGNNELTLVGLGSRQSGSSRWGF